MEPLFEAKALVLDDYVLYHIFRLDTKRYRAVLIENEDGTVNDAAPAELIITKDNGSWQTEGERFEELGETIGAEIDAFNNGYGAILGRIGN